MKRDIILAHLCIGCAGIIWGLMSPIGKDAMLHGIGGIDMVSFRVMGACLCFWLASLMFKVTGQKQEKVPKRDLLKFFLVAMFSVICNQCCYTIGLSITAPTNASIMTTTMPIITMILAAIVLREPISSKKVLGIALGVTGALILILSSTSTGGSKLVPASQRHSFCRNKHQDLARDGLRGVLRNFPRLHPDDSRTEGVASHRGEHIQLRPAHGGLSRKCHHRAGRIRMESGHSHRPRLYGCVSGEHQQEPTGFKKGDEEE